MKKVLMTLWLSGVLNYTLGQINSVYPDSGRLGEPLELNIISNNFFPPGIYLVILKQGSYQFDLSNNAYPYYPDSLRATGFIPFEAPPGVYDILVTDTATMNTYSLPASFTIPAPDGYANGEVYFDENLNGIRDIGEDGIANQMIECHSLMHAFFTDSNGFFHIPLYNGFYMVRHLYTYNHMYRVTSDTAMYNIQINNSDVNGLSFGLADMLHNTSPPISGFSTVSLTVESHFPFSFSTDPWGYISDARLIATPPDTSILIIPLSNITLISPYLIHMYFTIPVGQQTGVYDLRISTGAAFFQRKAFIITHSPSYLTGNVFFDGNSNGIRDIGEFPSQNKMLFLSPDSSYAFSNINGDYSFATPAGLHELSFASGDVVVTSVPVTYNFTNSSDSSGLDFGVRYTTADYTSDINLIPGFPRCNQNVTGTITYKNSSNVVSQGTIWMILSSNLIFVTSNPSIVSQNGDTLFWNFVHLQPGESRSITFTTTLPGVGLTISYYCNMIVTDALGNVMYTTADDGESTVTCSYDPNDKACDPPGVNDIMHYTLLNDTLEYLIRFQNSGTDTAFNIFIRDTLDASLDLSTFELLDVSHSMQLTIDSNRAAVFRFDNIHLPDSNVDEPNSHGYILYRIRPKAGLPDPTRVENRAYIYFDLNPPIETNTTWNTLVTTIPVSISEIKADDNGVIFYPNPMNSKSTFYFENVHHDEMILQVLDLNGKVVITKNATSNHIEVSKNGLSSGMYFYRLINTQSQKILTGKILVSKPD